MPLKPPVYCCWSMITRLTTTIEASVVIATIDAGDPPAEHEPAERRAISAEAQMPAMIAKVIE